MKKGILYLLVILILSSFVSALTTLHFREGCPNCDDSTAVPQDYLLGGCGGTYYNEKFFAIGINPLATRIHFPQAVPYLKPEKYLIKNYVINLTVYGTDGIYASVQNMTAPWAEGNSACSAGGTIYEQFYIDTPKTYLLNLTNVSYGLVNGMYIPWVMSGTYAYGRGSAYEIVDERPGMVLTFDDDNDSDGIFSEYDSCQNTPLNTTVDQFGCSAAQFCSQFNPLGDRKNPNRNACETADWKANEPYDGKGKGRLPDDCYIEKNVKNDWLDDVCMATTTAN